MRRIPAITVLLTLLAVAPAFAESDAEGCKDHPLFTRFPGTFLSGCESSQFDLRKFPVGRAAAEGEMVKLEDVEGPTWWYKYDPNEGTTPLTGLQVMRNFENAAKKAGGTVLGTWPGWCQAMYDPDFMPQMGNGCFNYGIAMKFVKGAKETWVFVQFDQGSYEMTVSEREAMKQDVAVNEIVDKLTKDGFVSLYVNFDTGKSTIKADSAKVLDDAAAALKAAPGLKVEVGGHTDNVGSPDANLKLSEERAKAVASALVNRGIAAGRLTSKGYGQTAPVADNRTEDGRARNRRVELVRK